MCIERETSSIEAFLAMRACFSCSPIESCMIDFFIQKTGQPVNAGTGRMKSRIIRVYQITEKIQKLCSFFRGFRSFCNYGGFNDIYFFWGCGELPNRRIATVHRHGDHDLVLRNQIMVRRILALFRQAYAPVEFPLAGDLSKYHFLLMASAISWVVMNRLTFRFTGFAGKSQTNH